MSTGRTWSWAFVAVVTLTLAGTGQGAMLADYTNLITGLFTNYNVGLRPRFDDSSPTDVYVGLHLLSLQVMWIGQRLGWTSASHNGITSFTYPQNAVWIPDLTNGNSVQTMKELGYDRNYVFIRDTGLVFWAPGGVFKTSCDIDVTYYPFDSQSCTIEFTTRISDSSMVELNFKGDSVNIDSYSESGTWDLVDLSAREMSNYSNYTIVGFQLSLKRFHTYYVVSVVFPVLFLSLTATLVFALPADSGEKMGTSITVLLSFAVYLTIVSEQMPKTSSHVSLLSVWLTMLLGMTALGVVLTVWILNLHFRDDEKDPPGKILRSIVDVMRRIMCQIPKNAQLTPVLPMKDTVDDGFKKRPSTAENITRKDVTGEPTSEVTWKDVAWTIDRFFFYFFYICCDHRFLGPVHRADDKLNSRTVNVCI